MVDETVFAPDRSELAGPWARFLAKRIDGLIVIVLSMLVGMLLGAIDLLAGTSLMDALLLSPPPVSFTLNAIVTLLLWFAYDVALLSAFGTTLGKKVMGVRIVGDGGKPGLAAIARRSALVLPLGLGLSLPFLSLITAIWGYVQVENSGRTVWDRSSGTWALGRKIGWWRWGIGLLVWLLIGLASAAAFVLRMFSSLLIA